MLLQVKISHLSHVGGLICGLFLSFLFLPKLRKGRRWEMLLPALGLGVFVLFYIAIPVYLYCFRFKSIDCVLPGGGHSI